MFPTFNVFVRQYFWIFGPTTTFPRDYLMSFEKSDPNGSAVSTFIGYKQWETSSWPNQINILNLGVIYPVIFFLVFVFVLVGAVSGFRGNFRDYYRFTSFRNTFEIILTSGFKDIGIKESVFVASSFLLIM